MKPNPQIMRTKTEPSAIAAMIKPRLKGCEEDSLEVDAPTLDEGVEESTRALGVGGGGLTFGVVPHGRGEAAGLVGGGGGVTGVRVSGRAEVWPKARWASTL